MRTLLAWKKVVNGLAEGLHGSHANLERKLAEKTRDLATLYTLTGPIGHAGKLTGVLDNAVTKILDVTGADAASIRFSEEECARLHLTTHRGFPEPYGEEISLETGQGRIGQQILRTGEAIISEELVNDSKFYRGLLAKHGFRSAAYLPLKASQGKVLGFIVLASRKPGRLSSKQSDLFAAIGHQISVALENARLYQESERQKEVQKLLRELNEDITSLEINDLVKKLTKKVREFFRVDVSDVRIAEKDVWQLVGASGIETGRNLVSNAKHVKGRSKWIVENRKPLLLADVSAAPSDLATGTIARVGIRGYAGIPLFGKGGEVIGILRAMTYQPRKFVQEEIDLLQQLANGAAVALENARPFQEKQRRAEEQHALREFLANLLLLDLDALLRRMTEQAATLFQADYSWLRLFEEDGSVKTRAVAGNKEFTARMSSLPERRKLVGRGKWMLENLRPLAVKDIASFSDYPSRGVKAGLHGFIGAPLFSRDRKPLGILYVMIASRREFSQRDLGVIAQFANGAAIAIENARLLKGTEKNLERLRALREIDQAITSTLDLNTIMNVLLERIERVFPCNAATLRLINRENKVLEPVACRNLDSQDWKTEEWIGGRGLANIVFESKTPVIIRNAQTEPRVPDREFYRKHRLVSYVGIPLIAKGENVGVLNCYTKEVHEFSDEEVEFLSTIAGQAAVAIHNSRLYQESRASKIETESINQRLRKSMRKLASLYMALAPLSPTESVDAMIDGIIERVMQATGADAALVWLRDDLNGGFPCASHRGFPDDDPMAADLVPVGSLVERVFNSGEPIIVSDIAGDSRLTRKFQLRVGLCSCAFLPLTVRGEVRGTLHLASRKVGSFSEEQKDHLMAIARQMSIALENRALFDELRASRDELALANKGKSEFLSMMSHELRTPLNVVMGYIKVVKEGMLGEITSEQDKALEKAIHNSKELLNMIGGILETSRIEAGAVTIESYAFSLEDFLDSLKSNYDVSLGKNVTLGWDYPSDLPPMMTDSEKLKHVLQNLINNALKFTDEGRVTVFVRHLSEAGTLEFQVSDTGVGIPKESLSFVFEMFRQVDSSERRPYSGVGLGLFIVKTLTELLGGKVEVESKVGEGSTFTVTIPRVFRLPTATPQDEVPVAPSLP